MNDYEILAAVSHALRILPLVPDDPDETVAVAVTKRELTLLSALLPLFVLSYPSIGLYGMEFDSKLKELVQTQRPEWLLPVDGLEG